MMESIRNAVQTLSSGVVTLAKTHPERVGLAVSLATAVGGAAVQHGIERASEARVMHIDGDEFMRPESADASRIRQIARAVTGLGIIGMLACGAIIGYRTIINR